MKRVTVSLPDELLDRVRRSAGGSGQVSSYVAAALGEHEERESLDELLAVWREQTPVPEDVRQQARSELDAVGLAGEGA